MQQMQQLLQQSGESERAALTLDYMKSDVDLNRLLLVELKESTGN